MRKALVQAVHDSLLQRFRDVRQNHYHLDAEEPTSIDKK
jgi:hypothetical protein